MSSLNIWWDNKLVGSLVGAGFRKLNFTYASTWLEDEKSLALSISLPLRSKVYGIDECRPFFAGLLPEGNQRTKIAKILGESSWDYFTPLRKFGEDLAGAVQLLPCNQKPPSFSGKVQTKALSAEELTNIIDELPQNPFLVGDFSRFGLRAMLAGAQIKLPVVLVDGKIGFPLRGQPTTHILKPAIPDLSASTENEAVVMQLAKKIGLDVANVVPMTVSNRTFVLVERNDRVSMDQEIVKRIHQEDFCQALRIYPENKYANSGGPTLKDCFTLIRDNSINPATDTSKFFDAVVFNLIVGNADAHGKNFSMLLGNDGAHLSPLYDLLSTVYYPNFTPDSSMKIGKCATLYIPIYSDTFSENIRTPLTTFKGG